MRPDFISPRLIQLPTTRVFYKRGVIEESIEESIEENDKKLCSNSSFSYTVKLSKRGKIIHMTL